MPRITAIFCGLVFATACATFYESNIQYNRQFEQGNLQQALEELHRNSKLQKPQVRFLYYVNAGVMHSMMGQYEESNAWFEKAFLFGEDFRVNYAREALSYITNPMVTIYRGEDHEHLMVLYYKALNFAKMGRFEEALVECRRLNIRLQQLSDRYSSENRYREDAFIHNLMGILYQASGDWNNAFIAYRNAYNIYRNFYTGKFGIQPPEQLKRDLLRAARMTGFTEEYQWYKELFGIEEESFNPEAELILLWHNGLAPVKDEWSINFMIYRGEGNTIWITNPDLGFNFSFQVSDEDRNSLSHLEFFRVAFPRYVERPLAYQSATAQIGDETFMLEPAEDINQIAKLCLHERMALEFSKSLIRVALKKATEYSVRKENRAMGGVISAINAMTETADTRNWQTLPHSIYYARIPLKAGKQTLKLNLEGRAGTHTEEFSYQPEKGQTLFHTFTSLEALQPLR
ncbi:MAG: hypothetical protein N2044_00400 [Cyclobacteriaceae bacterium]|nr:hypothetical protein [Cyclobacteriaceae bacterium]